MTIDIILWTIERELIRTYAVLDAWFDEGPGVLQYLPANGRHCCGQVLEQIMCANKEFLSALEVACAEARKRAAQDSAGGQTDWSSYTLHGTGIEALCNRPWPVWNPEPGLSHDAIREKMREQLETCLHYLDSLRNGEGIFYRAALHAGDSHLLDVYQHLYFLARYGRQHVPVLEENKAEFSLHGRGLN